MELERDSIQEIVSGESIRIRFSSRMKKRLFREKEITGRSVSEIVRDAVYQYFKNSEK